MNNLRMFFNPNMLDAEVTALLAALSEFYPVYAAEHGDLELRPELTGASGNEYKLKVENGVCHIAATSKAALCRAVASAVAGTQVEESASDFTTFAVLLDACRNFVFNAKYLKRYIAACALMGCNMAMFYTKDTYTLPDEPYFGYLRGSYTLKELQELDDFADKLGVELAGCIQALGHLEPVLRWPHYAKISDTPACLLTTEPDSYKLIRKMMQFYAAAFRSKRIHLGMDETHDLGRGRYIDLNGYRRGFDIYNEHLNKVVAMCGEFGFHPMIWSDMYFRMASKNMDYYDSEAITPDDVIAQIPPAVQLAYWDYFHTDKEFYLEWIRRHKRLGSTPVMTTGVWTWRTLWYDHETTKNTVTPCIAACRESGVTEIIFSLWGDDGGFCDWGSALSGLTFAADLLYKNNSTPAAARFAVLSNGADYDLQLELGRMNEQAGAHALYAPGVLWDDPLLQIYYKEQSATQPPQYWAEIVQILNELLQKVAAYAAQPDSLTAGRLSHAEILLRLMIHKIEFIAALQIRWFKGKTAVAEWDFDTLIQQIIADFTQAEESFRRQWYERGKVQGFEVMQIRLAGQRQRWCETARRLHEFLDGTVDDIPEITETVGGGGLIHQYKFLATGSVYL